MSAGGVQRLTATPTRLLLAIAAVAIVPLVWLSLATIGQQRNAAIDSAFSRLEGIAAAQVGQLETLIASDVELTELLTTNQILRETLADYETERPVNAGPSVTTGTTWSRSPTRSAAMTGWIDFKADKAGPCDRPA